MSFQECLKALARKGASSQLLRLVATFPSNRTMTVKVGSAMSMPRSVTGGCPQGSILGFFLMPRLMTSNKAVAIYSELTNTLVSNSQPTRRPVTMEKTKKNKRWSINRLHRSACHFNRQAREGARSVGRAPLLR